MRTAVESPESGSLLGALRRFVSSSIGSKAVMAVTGLLMWGFLVTHLAGNLLIYFDEATQQKTIVTLRGLLKDDGLLFVGPAESSALVDQHFVSLKVPHAFAFRKASPKAKPPIAPRRAIMPPCSGPDAKRLFLSGRR